MASQMHAPGLASNSQPLHLPPSNLIVVLPLPDIFLIFRAVDQSRNGRQHKQNRNDNLENNQLMSFYSVAS
jgi:hypothetical protein